MPKENLLDRLAGAMKTLGKREGKNLTPNQRVAAAQRWNSLADKAEWELGRRRNHWADANHRDPFNESRIPGGPTFRETAEDDFMNFREVLRNLGLIENTSSYRASNPFRFDWMGEPYQYEARLKNYRPLTDAQYERMLEIEDEARQQDLDAIHQEWYNNFIEPWRH